MNTVPLLYRAVVGIPFICATSPSTGDSNWSTDIQSPGAAMLYLVPISLLGVFVRQALLVAALNIHDEHLGSRHFMIFFGSSPTFAMFRILLKDMCPNLQCKYNISDVGSIVLSSLSTVIFACSS